MSVDVSGAASLDLVGEHPIAESFGELPLDHGQRNRSEFVVVHGGAEKTDRPAVGSLHFRREW